MVGSFGSHDGLVTDHSGAKCWGVVAKDVKVTKVVGGGDSKVTFTEGGGIKTISGWQEANGAGKGRSVGVVMMQKMYLVGAGDIGGGVKLGMRGSCKVGGEVVMGVQGQSRNGPCTQCWLGRRCRRRHPGKCQVQERRPGREE